jgi:Flp pilus assembly protein TadB
VLPSIESLRGVGVPLLVYVLFAGIVAFVLQRYILKFRRARRK